MSKRRNKNPRTVQIIIDDPIGEESYYMQKVINLEQIIHEQRITIEKASLIKGVITEVLHCDNQFGMHTQRNMEGLLYMSNCLCGEAGEVANVVKKLYRDGVTPDRIEHLHEEIVDVMIYLAELIYVTDMDFDAAWKKKHAALYKRWEAKKALEVVK